MAVGYSFGVLFRTDWILKTPLFFFLLVGLHFFSGNRDNLSPFNVTDYSWAHEDIFFHCNSVYHLWVLPSTEKKFICSKNVKVGI